MPDADRLNACKKAWFERNKEKARASKREWSKRNKVNDAAAKADWQRRNRDRRNADQRKYYARNRGYYAMLSRQYYQQIGKASVGWANTFFIDEIYDLARRRTQLLGIEFEVDHIVPIKSDIVCGLHCEQNLQVIPRTENMKKRNLWWPDMPDAIS